MNETMHKDHVAWRSDNSLWCDELRNWQYDFYKAKGDLPRLEAYIEAHERALASHAGAIRFYAEELQKHERVIASESGGTPDQCAPGLTHGEEAVRHQQQSQLHARIKAHHHKVMKQWRSLIKVLQERV
jgi:hypothetical protein